MDGNFSRNPSVGLWSTVESIGGVNGAEEVIGCSSLNILGLDDGSVEDSNKYEGIFKSAGSGDDDGDG